MDEVQRLVNEAREHADAVIRLATQLLEAGVDAKRVHTRYIAAMVDLEEEVDVRAVLASTGDAEAFERLGLLVGEFRGLRSEARAELGDQEGDAGREA